ncbi:MAG: CDP-diacylglycerol--glycerol-3-phosphate 3-phosphatidyltransferase [Actinomycetota bacterium]|nr:CDP-diacylglycerol--glycerol-3-phosphate 3-phosphatidyltransferase [Actinomycetota bacterium]
MANALTLTRIVIIPAFVWCMVESNVNSSFRYIAFALFILGALTDWADGFIARKTKTISRFGITADPLADRLFIGASLITLYCMRILPLAFLILVLGRDLLIAGGYPFVGKIDSSKVAVHWTGKAATAALFVALALLVLSPSPHKGSRSGFYGFSFTSGTSFQTYGLWLFVVGILWSLYSAGVYVSRVIPMLVSKEKEA